MVKNGRWMALTGISLLMVISLALLVVLGGSTPNQEVGASLPTLVVMPDEPDVPSTGLPVAFAQSSANMPPTPLPSPPAISDTAFQTPDVSPANTVIPAETAAPTTEPVTIAVPDEPVMGQAVIRFQTETSQQERESYITSIGGTINQEIDALDTIVVNVPQHVAQSLPDAPVVVASEPNYFVSAQFGPEVNDPLFPDQWGLPVIGVPEAWPQIPTDAPLVTVAVIDSGICAEHPDLQGRILPGWDFIENDDAPQDEFDHGCGVAGIIAATTDNGIGMAGVAPNAMIMPLRVLNGQGIGTYSNVAAAIIYAVDNGAQIINLSLGGTASSSVLQDAVDYAIVRDVVVIAAAGNTGENILYPAAYESVIAVGAVDQDLQVSSFSARGTGIGLLAPGRDITTTSHDGGYRMMSGTSFAAPYVAGVFSVKLISNTILKPDGNIVSFSLQQEPQTQLTETPSFESSPTPAIMVTFEPTLTVTRVPELREPFQPSTETGLFQWSPTANVIAFWQVNTLPGSPGFLNFDLLLFNVDSSELFVLAEQGEAGPMQFSADGSILWFWYDSQPFQADIFNGLVLPLAVEDIPIGSDFGFETDVDEMTLPTVSSVSYNFEYKIVADNGEFILYNRTTGDSQIITKNAQTHEQRILLFAREVDESVSAQADVANAFDFPICAPNLTGCYNASTYSQSHPGADYNGNGGGDTDRYWPVNAVANGRVVYSNYVGGGYSWGNTVMIEHTLPDGSKVWSQYAHLEDRSVNENTDVTRGQQIGRIGKGHNNQFAAHLHFEMRTQYFDAFAWQYGGVNWQNYYTNPTNYIDSHRQIGTSTTCANYSYNGVVLFDSENCGGDRREFDTTGFRNVSDFNDRVRSIYVGSNRSIRIWEHGDRGGATRCITSSMWDLNVDNYDNGLRIYNTSNTPRGTISSIEVFTNNSNCSSGQQTGTWIVNYYDTVDRWWDTNNSGNLRCSEQFNGPFIDRNYGTGARCGMDGDSWVADYSAIISFPSGSYVFYVEHDDGLKLWVNGQNIADRSSSGSSYICPPRSLNGNVNLRVLLREDGGDARVRVQWSTDTERCVSVPPAPQLSAPGNSTQLNRNENINLIWNSSSGATQYYAEFWGGPDLSLNSGWTSNTSWLIGSQWGGNYQWRVRARNSAGESSWSETRTLIVKYGSPTNLSASAVSESQVNLSWNSSSDAPGNITGYRIFRNGSEIATVGSSTTIYSDIGANCATNYNYIVRAYRDNNESDPSNTASVTTSSCPILIPQTPSNLMVSQSTPNTVTISWQDNSANETGFRVYKWGYDGSSWEFRFYQALTANIQTFTDTSLDCEINYFYQVSAFNDAGESNRTDWVEGRTSTCPDTTPPTGYMARPQRNSFQSGPTIELEAVASDDSGISLVEFYWSTNPVGTWTFIGSDTAHPYTYNLNVSSLPEETIWISARLVDNVGNDYTFSNIAEWTWFALDRTPPSSSVNNLSEFQSDTQFTVTWNGSDNQTDSDLLFFDVQYQLGCTGVWSDWITFESVSGASFPYGDYSETYCFRSRAHDLAGNIEDWPNQPDTQTTILNDTTPPIVSFLNLDDGDAFNTNTITVEATASDEGSGVSSLQFIAGYELDGVWDWRDIGWDNDGSDGWTAIWDANEVSDQVVAFFIYAYDRVGNYGSVVIWNVTLDRNPPDSTVNPLSTTQGEESFIVSWNGEDNLTPTDQLSYDVQYQVNDGVWAAWWLQTPSTEETFDGQEGTTYCFRSRAYDLAGNVEAWPGEPDTCTTVTGRVYVNEVFTTDENGLAESLSAEPAALQSSEAVRASAIKTEFELGDPIQLFISTINTTGGDETAYFRWIVTNPNGQLVPSMMWEGDLETAGGSVNWLLTVSIPQDAITGDYQFTGEITHEGEITSATILFFVNGIDVPASAPQLISPADQTSISASEFAWEAVESASEYHIQIDMESDFASPEVDMIGLLDLNFTASGLQNGVYYWRVRAVNVVGASAWSGVWEFTLNISSPNAAPERNSYSATTPTLYWGSVTWATGYEIQVDDNGNFNSPEFISNNLPANETSVTTDPLTPGTYYWRVRARRVNGSWGGWSAVDSFVITP